jgi:site-specific recombinase XerD
MKTEEEEDMNAALARVPVGLPAVEALAHRLAKEAPGLADLSAEQLETVARVVLGQRLARDLDRKADLAGIDYRAERAAFLAQAHSPHTARAYASALDRLDTFAARMGLSVLELHAKEADDFAQALASEGRAPASVRRDIAAASAFLAFLARRHDRISNPFRGSKARPKKQASRVFAYPSETEIQTILEALPPETRAAAAVMAYRGLRVGALPSLTIRAGRFAARSKGKDIAGAMPAEVLEEIKRAGLDSRQPFASTSETKLADAIRKRTAILAEDGKLAAAYSPHDLRHAFAVREYRKDRDIYRLSKLLGHASIQVTETYLKGLGELD